MNHYIKKLAGFAGAKRKSLMLAVCIPLAVFTALICLGGCNTGNAPSPDVTLPQDIGHEPDSNTQPTTQQVPPATSLPEKSSQATTSPPPSTEAPVATTTQPTGTTTAETTFPATQPPSTTMPETTSAATQPPSSTMPETTAAATQPAVPPSSGAASIAELINAQALSPTVTNDSVVDSMVASIIGDGSAYDRVKRAYDYIINNYSYATGLTEAPEAEYASQYDKERVALAKSMLGRKAGVCDNYAATLMIMMRRIGLDAYAVGGTLKNANGQSVGHAWVILRLSGAWYVFDAQADASIKDNSGGEIKYSYFGKSYKALGDAYAPAGDAELVSQYCGFALADLSTHDLRVKFFVVRIKDVFGQPAEYLDDGIAMELEEGDHRIDNVPPLKANLDYQYRVEIEILDGGGNYQVRTERYAKADSGVWKHLDSTSDFSNSFPVWLHIMEFNVMDIDLYTQLTITDDLGQSIKVTFDTVGLVP